MNENDFSLRDIVGLIRRQFRLLLATFLVVMGLTAGVFYTLKPVYTAAALVLVDPTHKDLMDPQDQLLTGNSDSPRVDSEVELVKAETTLLRVVKDADLLNDPEYAIEPGMLDRLLVALRLRAQAAPTADDLVNNAFAKLSDAVSVQRKGQTFLISIQARSGNAAQAAKIANALANAYIDEQLSGKISSILAASNVIQSRIADANQSMVASEEAFDNYISDNIGRIAAATGRSDLAQLREDLVALDSERTSLSSRVTLGAQSLAAQDWTSLAKTLEDDALAKLADDREKLEDSLGGAGSGDTASLRAQLADIDARLEARAGGALTGLRDQLASTQSALSDKRGQLRTDVLNADLPAETLASIYEVQQTAEIARSQYQALLARSKELESQAYLQVADSRIVSNALPPGAPSSPNAKVIFSLAAAIALLGGIGLALLYENFIGGFTSSDQLRSLTRLPVPAAIPRQAELRPADKNTVSLTLADYLVGAPLSGYSESIRRLRVGLDQAARRARAARGDAPDHTVIMVTSAAPGEGKTTTALGLARAYALSGSTTLLVDCDLRKPSLHRQLGIETSEGLLEYLAQPGEGRSLRSIVSSDAASGVQVIVGARQSDFATDRFVNGQSFSRLIKAATNTFDVVILDTPPIGPVVDGLYLASFVDVVAVLVRWGATSRRDLNHALVALADAKQPSTEVVAVLNQVDQRTRSYRSEYGGYYSAG